MRHYLFDAIPSIAGAMIGAVLFVGNAIGGLVAFVFNNLAMGLKVSGEFAMRLLDADRYEHLNATMEQRQGLSELHLLIAANQIKDDAVAGRVWTANHTNALNVIAAALHDTCGWEPVKVHAYLRPLVESIPGMGYTTEDDSEGAPSGR